MSQTHPSENDLSAFSLGALPPAEAAVIEEHLDECDSCCETMMGLAADDTFLGLVQRAGDPAGTKVDEASVPDISNELPPPLEGHPRYDVVRRIGRGGMGDVYEARHRLMNRAVALKVINREFIARPEVVERFRREVQSAARLSHPNIVTAHDAEQAGDVHFLVMEHVDGTDLSRVVRDRGPLPIHEACHYARQAALGLAEAHRLGLTHRDIKPHNLMVTEDGSVKVLDFGLASLVAGSPPTESESGRSDLTSAGTVMGTPDFISPEQADNARSADARSDVYSLGATLYFLLAGRPLFTEGDVARKLRSHAEDEPDSLASVRDDLPDGLADVVSRMIAKRPEERFQTATEVATALQPFCREANKTSTTPAAEPQPLRRHGPFSWFTGLATALAALLVAAAVYFMVTNNGVVRIEVLDDSLQVRIDGREVTLSEDGQHVQSFRAGDHEIVILQGESELITDEFELRRNGEVRFRVTLEKGQIVVSRNDEPPKTARLPTPERNGDLDRLQGEWELVSSTDRRGKVVVGDEGFRRERLQIEGNTFTATTWSSHGDRSTAQFGRIELDSTSSPKSIDFISRDEPDDKLLGIYELTDSALKVCSVEQRREDVARGRPVKRPETFESPAGSDIAVREFQRVPTEPGRPRTSLPTVRGRVRKDADDPRSSPVRVHVRASGVFKGHHGQGVKSLAFSPDGKLLASASQLKVFVRTTSNGEVVTEFASKGAVVFAPDGKVLAAVNLSGVSLWHVATGRKLRTFEADIHPYQDCYGVAFSPDGRRLAVGSEDGLKVWDVESGREPHSINAHLWNGNISDVAFSPDGARIASANWGGYVSNLGVDGKTVKAPNEVRVWDAETGKRVATLLGGGHGVAFSPDGKTIASGNYFDGTASVWDVATEKELHRLHGHEHGVAEIAFSPDGQWLATAGRDNLVKVWSTRTWRETASLPGHENVVRCVTFSPDGKRLYSSSDDKTIRVWEFADHEKPHTPGRHRDHEAIRGTWKLESMNGKPPEAGDSDFGVGIQFGENVMGVLGDSNRPPLPYVLDPTKTPKRIDIRPVDVPAMLGVYELEADTLRIGLSDEEGKRPTSLARSNIVLVLKWSPETVRARGGASDVDPPVRDAAPFRFGDQVDSLEYSRDGKRLISSGSGWGTAVWDAKTGDLIRHVPEAGKYLVASLSSDGSLMATSERNARTVHVRSVDTGDLVCSIDGGSRAVRFAPDGKSVFTVVGDRVARFDVATGERLTEFAGVGGGSSTFAVAPTGTFIAGIASPRNMRVWNWKDAKEVAAARSLRMGHAQAKDIVFTPDGESLVLLGEKNTGADLRDARTLEVTREFPGDEENKSTCVDVSADGSRMAFGSEGGLVFVYDLKTGELVNSWRAHTRHIAAVALSPDGTRLACGTRYSGSVRIWNVETLKPVFPTDTNEQQGHSEGAGNAALVYWQAFALLPELSGEDTKLLTNLEKGAEPGGDADSLLSRSKTALSLVSRLQPETPCRWELVEDGPSTLLPHLSEARTLARLLLLQAKVDAESGRPEAAVDHLARAFLVARNIDEGMLVQMLVGDGIESLAADAAESLLPKLDTSARERFAESLSKLPARTTFAGALRYERDVFGRGAGRMMNDALEQLGKGDDSPAVLAILAVTKKTQAMWLEELLAKYDKVIEASSLPPAEANKELERIEADVRDSPNPLVQLMMPSLVATSQRHTSVDARIAELEMRLRDAGRGRRNDHDAIR